MAEQLGTQQVVEATLSPMYPSGMAVNFTYMRPRFVSSPMRPVQARLHLDMVWVMPYIRI